MFSLEICNKLDNCAFWFKISPLCGGGGIRQKSGCFHRGNLLIFLFAFSLLFCQWRTFRCIFDAKQMIIYALAKKSDAWSASLGIFDSMAARPYGLVMCCYRHRLYTTIDRLVVQFREIHDRLPTLDTNQRLNQKLVGSDQPLFLAVASGEIDFLWFSSSKFKR